MADALVRVRQAPDGDRPIDNETVTTGAGLVYRQRVAVAEEIVVTRYDLASDTTNYIGKAPLGTSTAAAAWRIKRLQFVAGNLEDKMWSAATAVWDNRATESYT